jgi:hypothetical protein
MSHPSMIAAALAREARPPRPMGAAGGARAPFADAMLAGAIGYVGALTLNIIERCLLEWRAPPRGD